MTWSIVYENNAKIELNDIYDYIAYTLRVPVTAEKQIDRIITAIISLSDFPLKCRLYSDEPWRSKGLRVLDVDNYSVFYVPDETTNVITVYHIIYSRRDFGRHLGEPEEYV
jgi:toxin ParE1/3/4